MSVCHFDVQLFVSKMYTTAPSTSNRCNSSQRFWNAVFWVITFGLTWIKGSIFLLIVNRILAARTEGPGSGRVKSGLILDPTERRKQTRTRLLHWPLSCQIQPFRFPRCYSRSSHMGWSLAPRELGKGGGESQRVSSRCLSLFSSLKAIYLADQVLVMSHEMFSLHWGARDL